MTTACIIQARLGSTRLPAKVLLPLPTGRTVIEEVIYRCKRIEGVDVVVAALPETAENDLLLPYCKGADRITRGSERDVLARYAKAAEEVSADVVMRITSDCPLIDPGVCNAVLGMRNEWDYGYVSNAWPARHFPHGLDCEVFTAAALFRAAHEVEDAEAREHVGPAIRRVAADYDQGLLKASNDLSHLRWTLDTLDDYVAICKVFNEPGQHQFAA